MARADNNTQTYSKLQVIIDKGSTGSSDTCLIPLTGKRVHPINSQGLSHFWKCLLWALSSGGCVRYIQRIRYVWRTPRPHISPHKSIFRKVAIFTPFGSWSLCISASHRGIRQCPCPCHRGIHFQPSQFHTEKKNQTPRNENVEKNNKKTESSEKKGATWQVMEPSLSGIHWALTSQGLVRLLPQLISGLQPFTWSPVKPVLQLPQW